jgi:hypothetical protein
MIWKILLTVLVAVLVYGVIRARMEGRGRRAVAVPAPGPTPSWVHVAAYALLGIAALGSLAYWVRGWQADREPVRIQVVNADTGAVELYTARRGEIEGRTFRTLDGREVRLADVERMILLPPAPPR